MYVGNHHAFGLSEFVRSFGYRFYSNDRRGAARKTNQPRFNGYRIWDIRDWTPEADEGSEFLVAKVPLQKRNKEYKPTQVNPNLDSNGQIMLMQGDYGNSFVDGMMYNNTFGYHTLNYWQYVDYFFSMAWSSISG